MAGSFFGAGIELDRDSLAEICCSIFIHFWFWRNMFFLPQHIKDHRWSPASVKFTYMECRAKQQIFTFTLTLCWQNPWTKNIQHEHTTTKNTWDEQTISIQWDLDVVFGGPHFCLSDFGEFYTPTWLDLEGISRSRRWTKAQGSAAVGQGCRKLSPETLQGSLNYLFGRGSNFMQMYGM